jgi:hypothetical protein
MAEIVGLWQPLATGLAIIDRERSSRGVPVILSILAALTQ